MPAGRSVVGASGARADGQWGALGGKEPNSWRYVPTAYVPACRFARGSHDTASAGNRLRTRSVHGRSVCGPENAAGARSVSCSPHACERPPEERLCVCPRAHGTARPVTRLQLGTRATRVFRAQRYLQEAGRAGRHRTSPPGGQHDTGGAGKRGPSLAESLSDPAAGLTGATPRRTDRVWRGGPRAPAVCAAAVPGAERQTRSRGTSVQEGTRVVCPHEGI